MKDIDRKAKSVMLALFDLVVPDGLSAAERTAIAERAGVNPESLRVMRRRKTVNADTLIRLLLARGVSVESLESLKQSDSKQLTEGEIAWQKLGRELSTVEQREFASLVRLMKSKWKLS